MTVGHQSLKDVLIAGLTASVTDAERAAACHPPYPVPAAMAPFRDKVLQELDARLPGEGDGPLTVTRARGLVGRYRSVVCLLGRRHGLSSSVMRPVR